MKFIKKKFPSMSNNKYAYNPFTGERSDFKVTEKYTQPIFYPSELDDSQGKKTCLKSLFPKIKFLSVITMITLIQIFMFLFTVVYYNQNKETKGWLEVLLQFGAQNQFLIKTKFQIYRLVTPIFLHVNKKLYLN